MELGGCFAKRRWNLRKRPIEGPNPPLEQPSSYVAELVECTMREETYEITIVKMSKRR